MCKEGNLGQDNRPWKEKLQYESYMKSDPKFKTYIYEPPVEQQKKEPQTDDNLLSPNQSNRKGSAEAGDPDGEIELADMDVKKQNGDNVAS